jgi:hypothetical protein
MWPSLLVFACGDYQMHHETGAQKTDRTVILFRLRAQVTSLVYVGPAHRKLVAWLG